MCSLVENFVFITVRMAKHLDDIILCEKALFHLIIENDSPIHYLNSQISDYMMPLVECLLKSNNSRLAAYIIILVLLAGRFSFSRIPLQTKVQVLISKAKMILKTENCIQGVQFIEDYVESDVNKFRQYEFIKYSQETLEELRECIISVS